MRYEEFPVVAADGQRLRIRESWPENGGLHTFTVLDAWMFDQAAEPLHDDCFRIRGKVYSRVALRNGP
jgi:hypothetical protein